MLGSFSTAKRSIFSPEQYKGENSRIEVVGALSRISLAASADWPNAIAFRLLESAPVASNAGKLAA